MAEFPSLPLFTDAFIGDTTHLNSAQTGAYLMLLICAWRTSDCKLKDDDKMLARMARMDYRQWAKNKNIIMDFWRKDENQKWYQLRLLDEHNFVLSKRDQNIRAGMSSSLKRKGRHSTGVINPLQPEVNQPTAHSPHPLKLGKNCEKEEFCRDEILPTSWQDYAEKLSVPNSQIFVSWKRFKERSTQPWKKSNWEKWMDREKVKN